MSTSTKLLKNNWFVQSCFRHECKYPDTTRGTYKGIPVETFDNFEYNDVKFRISNALYTAYIKEGQSGIRKGAMKWIEQWIYEFSKQNGTYPFWCVPKLRKNTNMRSIHKKQKTNVD